MSDKIEVEWEISDHGSFEIDRDYISRFNSIDDAMEAIMDRAYEHAKQDLCIDFVQWETVRKLVGEIIPEKG